MITDAYYHSQVRSGETFLKGWESLLPTEYERSICAANTCIPCVQFNKKVQEAVQEHRC